MALHQRTIQETTRLSAVYRREADEYKIGSPARIHEYVQYRLCGYSQETSIIKTKE